MSLRELRRVEEVGTAPAVRTSLKSDGAVTLAAEETFTECLKRLKRVSGLSTRQLASFSWLTYPYVSRLVNWECNLLSPRFDQRREREERHPSRDTVFRLGLAMRLSIEAMDELLISAGFAPLVRWPNARKDDDK
jgi:hypothetical protein